MRKKEGMNKRFLFLMYVYIYTLIIFFQGDFFCDKFYGKMGYECVNSSVDWLYVCFVVFCAVLPSCFLPISRREGSDFILAFVYFFHVVPSVVLTCFYIGNEFTQEKSLFVLFISFSYVVVVFFHRFGVKKYFPALKLNSIVGIFLLFFLGVGFLLIIIKQYGFLLSPPSIYDVYGVRSEYIESSTTLSGYAVVMGGFVVAPFLLLVAIRNKLNFMAKILFVGLGFSLVFVIYSSSGLKSIAFIPFVSILFFFFVRKIKYPNYVFPLLISIFIIFGYALMILFDFDALFVHWIRRVAFSSGMNVSMYFDYFVINGHASGSDAPARISEFYYGTVGSANTGGYGDAIGRFGYIGFLINFFVFISMLWLLDAVAKGADKNIILTISFFMGYAICNSSLITVLITYGFILFVFLIYILKETYYLKECD